MMTTMIFHNLKVAVRNLMKYKLQTIISVLSIAIGIVTLALTHSIIGNFNLPPINDEPYADRAYVMHVSSPEHGHVTVGPDIRQALKAGGGLKNAERIVFSNQMTYGMPVEFHLPDSTVRQGTATGCIIDPEYANYAGLRSAVTGNKISKLKAGEAIVSEDYAKIIFKDKNPVGAVQTFITNRHEMPTTIVDVYKTLPLNYLNIRNNVYYFCNADSVEELASDRYFDPSYAELVLKEGRKNEQLQKELEERLKPYNVKVSLTKSSKMNDNEIVITIRTLVYLIGCLILVAAVIGFLRMQIQLVRLRSREISLRIVNGASRKSLFTLLMIEVGIAVSLAVVIAIVLGSLLQNFLSNVLSVFFADNGLIISGLWPFILAVGGCLILLCGLIVCVVLYQIYRSGKGLTGLMRGGRNHIFRNVMLGIQIAICLVFVCSSFILVSAGDKIKNTYLVPDNDKILKESLLLSFSISTYQNQLCEEIKKLPDLDRMVLNESGYYPIKELMEHPEAQESFTGGVYLKTYRGEDASLLDVMEIDVNWKDKEAHPGEFVLIQKDLYDKLVNFGILDTNSLTVQGLKYDDTTLPVAGTFSHIPYEQDRNSIIAITPVEEAFCSSWMLIPKPGKAKALERSVNEVIERVAPEAINRMVFNYRERTNPVPGMVETAVKGGWILGCVSLLICVMGIFSTITLDTRARKKEVAIRKVNGAKSGDIYRMFGKVYAWLILLSLLVAVPVSVLFGKMINTLLIEIDPAITSSFVGPIFLGCIVVVIFILGIVFWQIRRVMRVDPAKIIAKE